MFLSTEYFLKLVNQTSGSFMICTLGFVFKVLKCLDKVYFHKYSALLIHFNLFIIDKYMRKLLNNCGGHFDCISPPYLKTLTQKSYFMLVLKFKNLNLQVMGPRAPFRTKHDEITLEITSILCHRN